MPRAVVHALLLAILALCRIGMAQQPAALAAGVAMVTRLYDSANAQLSDIPYPASFDAFDSFQQKAAYARVIAAFSDEDSGIDVVTDHREMRTDRRTKMVIWTTFNMGRTSIVLIQAAQAHLATAINALRSGQTGNRTLAALDIPPTTRAIEIEIFSVGPRIMSQPLPCQRVDMPRINGALPCPTVMFMDSMAVPQLVENRYLTPLNAFDGSADLIGNAFRPSEITYNVNGTWFALPALTDTRLLAFNRTTFDQLKLKLPPPFGAWGENNKDWTWAELVNTAKQIKNAGFSEGFRFQADWNEENYLFSMIANSVGLRVVDERDQCAMADSQFVDTIKGTVGELWNAQSPVANRDIYPESADFTRWQNNPLPQPLEPRPLFCCKSNRPWGPGMTVVPASWVRQGLQRNGTFTALPENAEIVPAKVPGASILGGFGFGIVANAIVRQFAWQYLVFALSSRQRYINDLAMTVSMPPPYRSLLTQAPWNGAAWSFKIREMESAMPLRMSPQMMSAINAQSPFRPMLMELVFKQQSVEQSIDRACTVLQALSLPDCRNANATFAVGQCTDDLMNSTVVIPAASLLFESCRFAPSEVTPFVQNMQCHFVSRAAPVGISSMVLASFGILVVLILAVSLALRADRVLLSAPSWMSVLLGALLIFIAAFLFLGVPQQPICIARYALVTLGLSAVTAGVVAACVNVSKSTRHLIQSSGAWLPMVWIVLMIILVVIWAFVPTAPGRGDDRRVIRNNIANTAVNVLSPRCETGNAVLVWIMVGLNAFALVVATALAWLDADICVDGDCIYRARQLSTATLVGALALMVPFGMISQLKSVIVVALVVVIVLILALLAFMVPVLMTAPQTPLAIHLPRVPPPVPEKTTTPVQQRIQSKSTVPRNSQELPSPFNQASGRVDATPDPVTERILQATPYQDSGMSFLDDGDLYRTRNESFFKQLPRDPAPNPPSFYEPPPPVPYDVEAGQNVPFDQIAKLRQSNYQSVVSSQPSEDFLTRQSQMTFSNVGGGGNRFDSVDSNVYHNALQQTMKSRFDTFGPGELQPPTQSTNLSPMTKDNWWRDRDSVYDDQ